MFDDLKGKNNNAVPEEGRGGGRSSSQFQPLQPKIAKSGSGQPQFASPEKSAFPPAPKSKRGVEEIFSETDAEASQSAKPDVFKPKESQDLGAVGGQRVEEWQDSGKSDKMKKLLVLAVIIVGLGVVLVGGFWVVNKFFSKTSDLLPVEKTAEEQDIQESLDFEATEPADEIILKEIEPEIIKPLDSDQDGLTDDEERELGTDINSVDSDSDGLFDREEVKVYKTDPLDADTDGDGYLDGAEVKSGYNPKGAGRLYEIR